MRRRVGDAARTSDSAQLVVGAGLLMIVAQLAFRAWVLYPSWFFLDDYNLLNDAMGKQLDLGYLLSPYNSHLMPGGRLLAWIVASSGELNWTLAATITLGVQALASAASLWMLTTLFGARWAVLAPLSLYLSSAITLPATTWWAAALNQLPLQVAFFLAVGSWVRHLRGGSTWWVLVAACSVVLGLAFYVKAVLLFPVLAFIAVAYFTTGSMRQRMTTVLRRDWTAGAMGMVVLVGYLAYYLTHVKQLYTDAQATVLAEIADSMLGTAFVTGVFGGPWRWSMLSPPTAFADPPAWTVHLSWVLMSLVVLYAFLTRNGTLRAWLLLAGYLGGLLALLGTSRAPSFGRVIGLEYRYLTDAACVLALCVGLAFLPLLGADTPSSPRAEPLLRVSVPNIVLVALVLLMSTSGVISSALYAGYWHSDNASDAYLRSLSASLNHQGKIDLVDQVVPEDVMSNLAAPNNTVRRMTSLLTPHASFPATSSNLAVVAPDGTLHAALIQPGVLSQAGPTQDCGWFVTDAGRTIPLTGKAFYWEWWIRIAYLSSADSPVVVTAGSSRVETRVDAGLNNLYVKVRGVFDSVRVDGLRPGVTMCVDTIEVGQPVPGRTLP